MDHVRIPTTLFALAEHYGFVLLPKEDFEQQLAVTSTVLSAAFVMYDALDQIRQADAGNGDETAPAVIARQAQEDVDARFWPTTTERPSR